LEHVENTVTWRYRKWNVVS